MNHGKSRWAEKLKKHGVKLGGGRYRMPDGDIYLFTDEMPKDGKLQGLHSASVPFIHNDLLDERIFETLKNKKSINDLEQGRSLSTKENLFVMTVLALAFVAAIMLGSWVINTIFEAHK